MKRILPQLPFTREFRGFGYGKNLLTETLRQSIQRGAQLATLEVRER